MFTNVVYVGIEVLSRLVKQPEHVESGVTSGMAFSFSVDIFLDTLPHKVLDNTDVFICIAILARHQFNVGLVGSQAVAEVCELFLVKDKNAERFVYSNSIAR